MADHREVHHERLYVKEPRTERLRKTAAARLRYLLSTGWRETERWHAEDHITVKVERSGVDPRLGKMPYVPPPVARPARGDRGGAGGFRGGPGGFRGGPGGGRGAGPGGGPAGARGAGPGAGARGPGGSGAPPRT